MRFSLRRWVYGSVLLWLLFYILTHFLSPFEAVPPLDFNSTVLSWLNPDANFDVRGVLHGNSSATLSSAVYLYGCHNVHQINFGGKLGNGVTKVAFQGTHGPRQVVVKMVTPEVEDIKACQRQGHPNTMGDCYHFPVMKLMKEILMLQQLRHPNILRLLGYCLRSDETEMDSRKLHGLIAVYEHGEKIKLRDMVRWSLEKRILISLQLIDLLIYLETHALGSLIFPDFKLHHFLIVDNRIKLIDVDDMSSKEAPCQQETLACPFDLPCVDGRCQGANAKYNLANFHDTFAKHIFASHDRELSKQFKNLLVDLRSVSLSASELKSRLRNIVRDNMKL